ncbi:MAG: hypothetical protein ACXAB4_13210 [Candidatus Hodarchaeales archaeon]
MTPARFLCDECGYKGYLYLETDPESLKAVLEEKQKEKQKVLEEQNRKVEDWDKGVP